MENTPLKLHLLNVLSLFPNRHLVWHNNQNTHLVHLKSSRSKVENCIFWGPDAEELFAYSFYEVYNF